MTIINFVQSCSNFPQLNKIKKQASSQNWKSLTQKTKIWCNNVLSRMFGKYSFHSEAPKRFNLIKLPNAKSNVFSI